MQHFRCARMFVCALLALATGCRFQVDGEDAFAPGSDAAAVDASSLPLDASAGDLASGGDLPAAPDDSTAPADLTTQLDLAAAPDSKMAATASLVGAKTNGPSSANLSTEGTADWIDRGLTAASDVNRKATGGSRITVSANATLNQYTSYTTMLSWNDGAPTASATNTTNGVYVLGVGTGFTITTPADTTVRTLRLYLNVGGAASLTSHVSDGSVADYTDSQVNTNNGATWLYTIRYAAASAGQTLTTTWQLTAGTGVSFLAATLQ